MELTARELPADCEIYDTSCLHYGALNCYREGIREIIDEVGAKRNRFLLNKGDSIDAVLPNDKRYASCAMDVKENLLTPAAQCDALVKDFLPIRKQILAWGHGNHEFKLINTMDFGRYIAAQLQVPYGGVTYKFAGKDKTGATRFKMLLTHGRGMIPQGAKDPIQREANQKAWVRRKLESMGFADCVYMSMAHIHRNIVVKPTTADQLYLTDDGENIHQHYQVLAPQDAMYIPPDSRFYASTGSFLGLYSKPGSFAFGYGELAQYGPTELGCCKVIIRNHQVVDVEKRIV